METLTIRTPDDFHIHFRDGEMAAAVVPYTAKNFGRALVMPNLSPQPITDSALVSEYRRCLNAVLVGAGIRYGRFEPLMAIQITEQTTPAMIREAKDVGAVAGKVYPKGVTTNSQNGVSQWELLDDVFNEMARVGMVLSIHGQKPGAFCLDREYYFLETLWGIARGFDKLRIVLEHVSIAEAVKAVSNMSANVAATITAHHLLFTLDDVLSCRFEGGVEGLNPHHYCQPIPQRPSDRAALIAAATSGNPKFFFGSDSAPHVRGRKESSCGCAGVFSAPVALPVLAQVFEQAGALDKLEAFTSEFGARHYGLPLNNGTVTLTREPWQVPLSYHSYDTVVPLCAGQTLDWQCSRD